MLTIFKRHPYILLFSGFQMFFSAPGQTFLLGLFVDPIFTDLNISRSLFAGIYAAATLIGSALLNPAGKCIDRYPLRNIVIGNSLLMSLGCFTLAFANNGFTLFIGLLLLRAIGQGVFGLTASTVLVKNFNRNRGKSLSVNSIGYPISEMLYPTLALSGILLFGWRPTYMLFGASYILLMLPIQLFLIARSNIKSNQYLLGEDTRDTENKTKKIITTSSRDFTLKEALGDIRFYLILLPASLGPVMMTILFFHQQYIFEMNHWPLTMITTGMGYYAGVKIANAILVGPIVDRIGALIPFVVGNIILAIGIFILGLNLTTGSAYFYFGICGAALGIGIPIGSFIWPYFYGLKHIGSIKGFYGMVRNALTALGPVIVAVAIDRHIDIHTIILWIAAVTLIIALLPIIAYQIKPIQKPCQETGV